MNKKVLTYLILTISFIEGGAVMFAELVGAKIVAPFFGTSLVVWSSALGITLGSLAAGYYTGGYFSKKMKGNVGLFWVFLFVGLFITIMPITGKWIMESTIDFSIQTGVTISMLVFLSPPLIFCGMMSPMIIKILTDEADNAGRVSGLVYSISTVGGILATYLTGFYILPELGIIKPTVFFGTLLVLLSLTVLLVNKKYISVAAILLLIFVNPYGKLFKPTKSRSYSYKVLYEKEGVLGQVKVVDHNYYTRLRGVKSGRGLLVNNTNQTIMDNDNPEYSLWDFAFFFPAAASVFPKGSDALILGLGGGTLLKQYERLGFNVDVAELDQRVKDVSIEYFSVDPNANIVIDDARHYLKTAKKKYDIITFDLFLSETPPSHLLTTESFEDVKKILKPNGLLMINFYGFTSGETGRPSRSVFKTLEKNFECTDMLVTPSKTEISRNLIFLASDFNHDFTQTNYSEPSLPQISNLEAHFLNPSEMDFSDALLLVDDKPIIEHLYVDAAKEWRIASNNIYTKNFIKEKISNYR